MSNIIFHSLSDEMVNYSSHINCYDTQLSHFVPTHDTLVFSLVTNWCSVIVICILALVHTHVQKFLSFHKLHYSTVHMITTI